MLGLDLTQEPRAIQEAKEEGERSLILHLLTKKMGTLDESMCDRISTLSSAQLTALGEALLDFNHLNDIHNWLATQE
ncbi:hypothetical protein C1752_03458 [Acaryochloris thomasi RCC1774]|uniref:DUF4351 domain-containing protein n=1 Tax=Acaryochloris thomasi RCC1774 TaxID=1764569 RepID=A0A2W1JP21_9CYAN|nr:DUF4351 domain-containing protein [Acaryochloris thomasi]PZD72622.1 hypothetical protein C1752_03458 [Acaryochloris thomasi RCC1774]